MPRRTHVMVQSSEERATKNVRHHALNAPRTPPWPGGQGPWPGRGVLAALGSWQKGACGGAWPEIWLGGLGPGGPWPGGVPLVREAPQAGGGGGVENPWKKKTRFDLKHEVEQPACLDTLASPLVQESSHQGPGGPGGGGCKPKTLKFGDVDTHAKLSNQPAWTPLVQESSHQGQGARSSQGLRSPPTTPTARSTLVNTKGGLDTAIP